MPRYTNRVCRVATRYKEQRQRVTVSSIQTHLSSATVTTRDSGTLARCGLGRCVAHRRRVCRRIHLLGRREGAVVLRRLQRLRHGGADRRNGLNIHVSDIVVVSRRELRIYRSTGHHDDGCLGYMDMGKYSGLTGGKRRAGAICGEEIQRFKSENAA